MLTVSKTVPIALGAVVVASIAFAAVLPLTARADGVVPIESGSALVQTQEYLALYRTTVKGPVSVGGDLSFRGPSWIAGAAFVDTPVTAGGSRPVQVYVGGRIDWPISSRLLNVQGPGDIAVGDLSTSIVDDTDADTELRAGVPTNPLVPDPVIRGGFDESSAEVSAADLAVDVNAQFGAFAQRSATLSTCEETVQVTADEGEGAATVVLTEGITNVWNVDEVTLDAIDAITFAPAPSPTTKLVVNVFGATGDISFPAGMTEAISPHILYNLVGTGTIRLTGLWPVRGTLYAPGFRVTSINPTEIEGNVIVKSFAARPRGASMVIEDHGFAGVIDCGQPVVSETTTTTTSAVVATTTTPATTTTSVASDSATTGSTTTGSTTTGPATTVTTTTVSTTTGSTTTETTTTGPPTEPATTESTTVPTTTAPPTTETVTTGSATITTTPVVPTTTTASTTSATATEPGTTTTTVPTVTSTTTTTNTGIDLSATDEATDLPAPGVIIQPPPLPAETTTTTPVSAIIVTSGDGVTSATQTTGPVASATLPADPEVAEGGIDALGSDPETSTIASASTTGSTLARATTTTGSVRSRLSMTGADIAGLVLTGFGLLAAGVGMTWTTRRQGGNGRHIA